MSRFYFQFFFFCNFNIFCFSFSPSFVLLVATVSHFCPLIPPRAFQKRCGIKNIYQEYLLSGPSGKCPRGAGLSLQAAAHSEPPALVQHSRRRSQTLFFSLFLLDLTVRRTLDSLSNLPPPGGVWVGVRGTGGCTDLLLLHHVMESRPLG